MLPGGCPEVLPHLRNTYTHARVEPSATSALASHLWGLSCPRLKIEEFLLSLLRFFIFSSKIMNMRTFSVMKHLAFSYSCGMVSRAIQTLQWFTMARRGRTEPGAAHGAVVRQPVPVPLEQHHRLCPEPGWGG